jgi:hypothetical protein
MKWGVSMGRLLGIVILPSLGPVSSAEVMAGNLMMLYFMRGRMYSELGWAISVWMKALSEVSACLVAGAIAYWEHFLS